MTFDELNAKIEALPLWNPHSAALPDLRLDRAEARHLRDERLGIMGCHAGMVPTQDQIDTVVHQLFPPPPQPNLI